MYEYSTISIMVILKLIIGKIFLKKLQRDLRDSEAGRFITTYKKISELQKEVAVLSISNAKQVIFLNL